MINHIRTLLLNETQTSLSQHGFEYGYPWLVSPKFSGIRIPDNLVPLRNAIFSGADSIDDRIRRVEAIMSLLGAVDMSEFRSLFDGRSTVTGTRQSFSIRELFTNSKYASSGFEKTLLDRARSTKGLYASTGRTDSDPALHELSRLAGDSFEWPLRVAAVVFAYCIQLDKLNTAAQSG